MAKKEDSPHSIWNGGCFRVFLSHLSEDKKEIAELKKQLELFGISCFVAHEDIRATKEWQKELESALSTMDALIAIMTEKFHESDWTDQEIGVAVARKIPIISLKMGKDPYGFIGKFQALPWKWGDSVEKLIKIFMEDKKNTKKIIDAYIKALQKCENFARGEVFAKVLPFINKLENDQEKLLIAAYNENSQIGCNAYFNGRIGKGLLYHLNRITGRSYDVNEVGEIVEG
ncbi:MAG: toll/interleukin-1 receptor domain-containing protein [Alphaproteobacteria bacterium]|nr:toll/interleukin-1 receptor domain-containing protein [Alphaproteobacteria bacterium]